MPTFLNKLLQVIIFKRSDGSFFAFMSMFSTNPFICLLFIIHGKHTKNNGHR